MSNDSDFIEKIYNCPQCKETHSINFPKGLAEDRPKYPFPHVYLHGKLKDLLTTLYIDRDLQIRGVEVIQLVDSDIFSKDQAFEIVNKLMDVILKMQEENQLLLDRLYGECNI